MSDAWRVSTGAVIYARGNFIMTELGARLAKPEIEMAT